MSKTNKLHHQNKKKYTKDEIDLQLEEEFEEGQDDEEEEDDAAFENGNQKLDDRHLDGVQNTNGVVMDIVKDEVEV